MKTEDLVLESSTALLRFDRDSFRLTSLTSRTGPVQEFISSDPQHPVFILQYLDSQGRYQQISSTQARGVSVEKVKRGNSAEISGTFTQFDNHDITITARATASLDEPEIRWAIGLKNNSGLRVSDIQYPYIICTYSLGGREGSERILLPHDYGKLLKNPSSSTLQPDSATAWQLSPHNGAFNHYPGGQFAQFVAYYNDRAGLYLACDDTEGNIKRFGAMHRDPGFHLGVTHIGDWPEDGERKLEYDTITRVFTGDWYDAAELYRSWSLKQKWGTPLHRRRDIPDWLLESPPHITIRPQGHLDSGPVFPVEEFLPYKKCIPLLANISEKVDAPLVAVIMGWERGGSWVYPDCFPPIGGDAALEEFTKKALRRGWRIGSFCNGTRWVVGHSWNDYNGWDYYYENDGDNSVSRLPDGTAWQDTWDQKWRPSYVCCMGSELTRSIATNFVKRLIGWGLDSIQFFDQNCGATTFPCFAENHDHPPMPGKWMTAAMERQMSEFRSAAVEANRSEVIHSTEMACNEYCLQLFQQSDSRLWPPGHRSSDSVVPVYQYLYHECIIMHGGMGYAPEPYHLEIRNAYNGVMGEIAGGVLTGDGTLLDKDTSNWADWLPKVGNSGNSLAMIRAVTALRRGPGRDFLVFGRMEKPAEILGVEEITWEFEGISHAIPSIFDAAWLSPDGTHAVVLSNWTEVKRRVEVRDPRLGPGSDLHISADEIKIGGYAEKNGGIEVELPPLSIALLQGVRS